ncbi:MAG: hypothetical protein ABIF09_00920 [Gemmatimonadota bacterium]
MSSSRAFPLVLALVSSTSLLGPLSLRAQEVDRIWGRVQTVSGQIHEGFIRWDRNEGSWVDQLDGSKEHRPFEFQDWWKISHPGDKRRDRVIELAGYRITWDDDEPDFPDTAESGIRFGHIRRLTVVEGEVARLELRSGSVVELEGGATDLGEDLREILIKDTQGRLVELAWEELAMVEFMAAPATAEAGDRRLHGTVEVKDGPAFTGYISWDTDKILSSDPLEGRDSDKKRREIPFGRIASILPIKNGAEVTLMDGGSVRLFGTDDVTSGNAGIQISDPGLGLVDVDWDDLGTVRFHPPEVPVGWDAFDGGRRLRGTVVTADSTELTGWIKWDGDEEYSWELLDGRDGDLGLDVEFGKIASIERSFEDVTSVNLGPAGLSVRGGVRDRETLVTLRDGRILELGGSNDVDESNHGIFVLGYWAGNSPDDEDAEWVMVRWEDFRAARFNWEDSR